MAGWMEAISSIGNFAEKAVNAGVNIFNAVTGRKNYEAQKNIAEQSNDLQRESFLYNKWLNQEQMNREDNAVQRKVADLKAAGLNPVLASGGGASSSAGTPISSPNLSVAERPKLDKFEGMSQLVAMVSTLENMQYLQALRNKTELDIKGQDTRNAGYEIDNLIKMAQLDKVVADTLYTNTMNDEKSWNLSKYKEMGIATNGSMPGKMATEAFSVGKNFLDALIPGLKQIGSSTVSGLKDIGSSLKSGFSTFLPSLTPQSSAEQKATLEKIKAQMDTASSNVKKKFDKH